MTLPFLANTANTAPQTAAPQSPAAAPQRGYNPFAACDKAELFVGSRTPLRYGRYLVQLDQVIWNQDKAQCIFEYHVVQSEGPDASPVGSHDAIVRMTGPQVKGWFNYLCQNTLIWLGLPILSTEAEQTKPYISAILWSESTKQPQSAADGTVIQPGALVGRTAWVTFSPNPKGPNEKGKYYPKETWEPVVG